MVVSLLLALLQLSVVPRMPGLGMWLNILVPFLLAGSWYFGFWGIHAALIVSVFEMPYTSLSPFFMVLSLVLPCVLVAFASSTVVVLHPSQKPFPYRAVFLLMVCAMLLYIMLRSVAREGGVPDIHTLLAEGVGILVNTHFFVWIMVTWYGKNISKPFFYKRV